MNKEDRLDHHKYHFRPSYTTMWAVYGGLLRSSNFTPENVQRRQK